MSNDNPRVLFAVDEAYPLYKIGGLGDVGGSLPKALIREGIDVRLIIPGHPEVNTTRFTSVSNFEILYDAQKLHVEILMGELPGTKVPVYVVKEDGYISQKTDASDNHADKFAVFSLAIVSWIHLADSWEFDLLHIQDWHTSLIPLIQNKLFTSQKQFPTLLTIHNLAYQGRTTTPVLQKMGFSQEEVEQKLEYSPERKLNILLEGIKHSTLVNTVSERYVEEIQTEEYGEGIDNHLRNEKEKLYGILNGLDLEVFNPATDPYIRANYDVTNFESVKAINKLQLQTELDLTQNKNSLLIGFVGRVDRQQKGVQLIIEGLNKETLIPNGAQFVFLGIGDKELEQELQEAASNYKNVRIYNRYDEALATQIYSAADLMIIPSKFEPCGLVQMIAMRYGSLPVARKTGGLADTIIHETDGFLFESYQTDDFCDAIHHASNFISDRIQKRRMMRKAMLKDFSWNLSAKEYIKLYVTLAHGIV